MIVRMEAAPAADHLPVAHLRTLAGDAEEKLVVVVGAGGLDIHGFNYKPPNIR